METDENSSDALGAGEHGGGSHQLQSPGSNPLGVGQGGNAAEGYVAKYAAKEDTKVNRSLSAAEGYVAKYAAKEDTKMNRSLSGVSLPTCVQNLRIESESFVVAALVQQTERCTTHFVMRTIYFGGWGVEIPQGVPL